MKIIQPDAIGIFPIYKPYGKSSHWVVTKLRFLTGQKRIGHGGTLDPLAEGVLVVGITRTYTKQLNTFLKQDKEYITEIRLGQSSTTDDESGEKTDFTFTTPPSIDDIKAILPQFTGEIWQVPPSFSAVKINGVRAYRRTLQKDDFMIEPRLRKVKEITLLEYNWPLLKLKVITGSGVYIRSLARDIGEKLQTGGYITSLIRTRVGDFSIDDCYSLPEHEYNS